MSSESVIPAKLYCTSTDDNATDYWCDFLRKRKTFYVYFAMVINEGNKSENANDKSGISVGDKSDEKIIGFCGVCFG